MLFHYPKQRHKRQPNPGPFRQYQTYKKYLRKEFGATCVYCRMPDRFSEKNSFAVEHYKPKSRFPELENDYANLFYSCQSCNTYKSNFWPSKNQLDVGEFIPNPCDHVMHDHLETDRKGVINARSKTGQWTLELLDFNNPDRIKKRQFYISMEARTIADISKASRLAAKIKSSRGSRPDNEIDADLAVIEEELESLRKHLSFLQGDLPQQASD